MTNKITKTEIYRFELQIELRKEAEDLRNRLANFNEKLEKAEILDEVESDSISETIAAMFSLKKKLSHEISLFMDLIKKS